MENGDIFMKISTFASLVKKVNKDLGDFCNTFGSERKRLANLGRTPTKNQLFTYKEENERDWAINEGGGTEVQYHLFMYDNKIGYGIGFNAQYVQFKNEMTPVDYIKPFVEAFISIKNSGIINSLKKRGFYWIYGEEENLQNIQTEDYFLFGKTITIKNKQIPDSSYEKLLKDIQGDLFTVYKEVFERRNTMLNLDFDTDITELLKTSKNIILQGAPGTGKTYSTALLALSIIEPEKIKELETHEDVMSEYERLSLKFDKDGKIQSGNIGFITFHQSMDYEDFIEGLKPSLEKDSQGKSIGINYEYEDGIFKKICLKAQEKKNDNYDKFEKALKELKDRLLSTEEKIKEVKTSREGSEFSLYYTGGKTFSILPKQAGKATEENPYRANIQSVLDCYKDPSNYENVYNPTYVKGIVNYIKTKNNIGDYSSVKERDEKNKYVLIIDEINRGNVSKIFGELITLIEADKRLLTGDDKNPNQHTVKVILPYSKQEFSVPSNLYIIGTMNTTDRSVGSLDYAIRRRFAFVTLESDRTKIEKCPIFENDDDLREKALQLFDKVYDYLNTCRKEMNIKDLMVGHSYFMARTLNELRMKLNYSIIPLIREYEKDGIILVNQDEMEEEFKSWKI